MQIDISQANTPAMYAHHRFHEEFNRSLKTNAVALAWLESTIKKGTSIDTIKSDVYQLDGIWGGMPDWTDFKATLTTSRYDLGAGGLMRVFSALDVFIERIEGSLNAWESQQRRINEFRKKSGFKLLKVPKILSAEAIKEIETRNNELAVQMSDEGTDPKSTAESESTKIALRVIRFYTRQNWQLKTVEYLLPIFNYFQLMRHCAAHSNARATPALSAASQRSRWEKQIEVWKEKTGEITPPTPTEYVLGDPLKITHKDAVLASSLVRRFALDMNSQARNVLGEHGMLFLAMKDLMNGPADRYLPSKDHYSRLHEILRAEYRFSALDTSTTRHLLEEIMLWDEWKKILAH